MPWDEPTTGCNEFVKWKSDNSWMTLTPWSKMETIALSLLRRILEPNSTKRITVSQIIEHKWCNVKNSGRLYMHILKIIKYQLYLLKKWIQAWILDGVAYINAFQICKTH